MVVAVIKKYGRIDVWVNNAGIGPNHMLKTADHSLQDWERVIAVNQSGVFYGMKVVLQDNGNNRERRFTCRIKSLR